MKNTNKFYVLCMAFDGEYITEPFPFDTIEEARKHETGSKWYFYPFEFICKGQTVKDCGHGLTHLEGKRIKTVVKHFNELYEHNEENSIEMNAEEYWFAL